VGDKKNQVVGKLSRERLWVVQFLSTIDTVRAASLGKNLLLALFCTDHAFFFLPNYCYHGSELYLLFSLLLITDQSVLTSDASDEC